MGIANFIIKRPKRGAERIKLYDASRRYRPASIFVWTSENPLVKISNPDCAVWGAQQIFNSIAEDYLALNPSVIRIDAPVFLAFLRTRVSNQPMAARHTVNNWVSARWHDCHIGLGNAIEDRKAHVTIPDIRIFSRVIAAIDGLPPAHVFGMDIFAGANQC
ncbi:hypothetical protein CHX26_08385 [Porphyrobacter sp. HT-58-2]|nr:hypothetical protein CHX26_08385 [Porphyrobacter sp. HT-58-2]